MGKGGGGRSISSVYEEKEIQWLHKNRTTKVLKHKSFITYLVFGLRFGNVISTNFDAGLEEGSGEVRNVDSCEERRVGMSETNWIQPPDSNPPENQRNIGRVLTHQVTDFLGDGVLGQDGLIRVSLLLEFEIAKLKDG